MKITLEDIITMLCAIGLFVSVAFMIGTVGAVEMDQITMKEAITRCAICLVVMAASVFGLNKIEKNEEENVYDRL